MIFETTGTIAKKLNVDRDKVSHAIRKLRIEPIGMAGPARVFSDSTLTIVKKFLSSKAIQIEEEILK